jgi:hypothetical protein
MIDQYVFSLIDGHAKSHMMLLKVSDLSQANQIEVNKTRSVVFDEAEPLRYDIRREQLALHETKRL